MELFVKDVDKSLLTEGMAIPNKYQKELLDGLDISLDFGQKIDIDIVLNNERYKAVIKNQSYDKDKYKNHVPVMQIRYSPNSDIVKRLREVFVKTKEYMELTGQTKIPEEEREYVKIVVSEREKTIELEKVENKIEEIKVMNQAYELIPDAKMLLSSLRSVGYTEETAIADIVDNSISSGATRIELHFDWDNKQIIIADNGEGMSREELLEAMKIGSSDPLKVRDEKDLGRFGMGMKTAAFSLAKKLIVISKHDSQYTNAMWDMNYVEETNKWEVLILNKEDVESSVHNCTLKINLEESNCGTVIILKELDKLIDDNNLDKSKKKFYKIIKKIKAHLAMIFHRFIEEDDLEIYVNGNLLKAWNPFYLEHPATMELACEELDDGKNDVIIEPYILPHKNKFKNEEEYEKVAGVKGWLRHQGFYVYRNRRLIVYGTWFGKFKREPAYNLARIKLDMSSESDFEWGIDIKKSKATLPVSIEENITEIANLAIQKSVAVYNSRGVYKRKSSNNTSLKYVWEQRKNSSGNYMFYLNKKHPLLIEILQGMNEEKQKELKTYLTLIENFSPTMLSGVISDSNSTKEVEETVKEKDMVTVKEKIRILKKLDYDDAEIIDVISESPEYAYLTNIVKEYLKEI